MKWHQTERNNSEAKKCKAPRLRDEIDIEMKGVRSGTKRVDDMTRPTSSQQAGEERSGTVG
jgi:hypothetical protein